MSDFENTIKNLLNTPPAKKKRKQAMGLSDLQLKILKILQKERTEHGKHHCLSRPEIAERLGIEEKDVESPIRQLIEDYGCVKVYTFPCCVRITQKGLVALEPDNHLLKDELTSVDNSTNIVANNINIGDKNKIISTEILKSVEMVNKANVSQTKKAGVLKEAASLLKAFLDKPGS